MKGKINDCCAAPEKFDCCESSYQLLENLRAGWSSVNTIGTGFFMYAINVDTNGVSTWSSNYSPPKKMNGASVPIPVGGDSSTVPVVSIWGNDSTILNAIQTTSALTLPLSGMTPLKNTTTGVITNSNFLYAFYFVQTNRYLTSELCNKFNQVTGWYVNFSNGQLQLFQGLCDKNLKIGDTRSELTSISSKTISSIDKNKLKAINAFYEISERAASKLPPVLPRNGLIVEVTDNSNNKWLVAVNKPNGESGNCGDCSYVMVAINL